MTTQEIILNTRGAKNALLTISTECKNMALLAMADALLENEAAILAANLEDMTAAKGKLSDSM